MPAKIDPKTIIISAKGGIIENNADTICFFLLSPFLSSSLIAGAKSGLI